MKFSILMPTFRRKSYLRDAVIGLKSQVYQEWELVIKEGGNGEGHSVISDLISEDNRILYIHSKDKGITDAMNQAMRVATGDIFMWANDDDILLPETLKTVSENIGGYPWGYGKIKMTRNGQFAGEMGYPVNYDQMKDGNKIPQPAVFWTREAYRAIGGMSEDQDLVSDYEYWCRLLKNFPDYKFIDSYLAEYRLHADQITTKIVSEQLRQANIIKQSL
jgi:glycosyltransferase involved in cell wall biosynthesis